MSWSAIGFTNYKIRPKSNVKFVRPLLETLNFFRYCVYLTNTLKTVCINKVSKLLINYCILLFHLHYLFFSFHLIKFVCTYHSFRIHKFIQCTNKNSSPLLGDREAFGALNSNQKTNIYLTEQVLWYSIDFML